MRDLVNVDMAELEQRTAAALLYTPGSTWRGSREQARHLGWPGGGHGRCTYNPIDPWTMRRRDKPFDVFVNGTACLSYASLDAALSHLRARGFNMPDQPVPLYPDCTDVSSTGV